MSNDGNTVNILLKTFLILYFDWQFSLTVKACYRIAKDAGMTYFAVQFYGECWASNDEKFRDYGQATNCYEGVGAKWSNYVYKIRVFFMFNANEQPPSRVSAMALSHNA